MAGRRANGEGSIYKRSDGRWGGSVFVELTDGRRKRVHVYARTRHEVHELLAEKLAASRRGIRTPVKQWTVGDYLVHWLTTVVAETNRPRTYEIYESTVRVHISPAIGDIRLTTLTPNDVQHMINAAFTAGGSTHLIHRMRRVLRTALSNAEREELIFRNAAKLVKLRSYRRKPITPWSVEQAAAFLHTAKAHRWYGAYIMVLAYGTRRGETLGLRWSDIDLSQNRFHIEQQLQRIGKELIQCDVKTETSRRWLPLIPALRDVLLALATHLPADADKNGLVFLSGTGTPIDPKNLVREFHRIRERAGLPRITLHHARHTVATLLKKFGVSDRDAQLILGHSNITTTQQIYQHADIDGQTEALKRVNAALTERVAVKTAANRELSIGESTIIRVLTSGGPGGARTLDALLKRLTELGEVVVTTPVIEHVLALTRRSILGRVAVKKLLQMPTCKRAREHAPDTFASCRHNRCARRAAATGPSVY